MNRRGGARFPSLQDIPVHLTSSCLIHPTNLTAFDGEVWGFSRLGKGCAPEKQTLPSVDMMPETHSTLSILRHHLRKRWRGLWTRLEKEARPCSAQDAHQGPAQGAHQQPGWGVHLGPPAGGCSSCSSRWCLFSPP